MTIACVCLTAFVFTSGAQQPVVPGDIDKQASLRFLDAYDMMYVGRTLEDQGVNEEALDFYTQSFKVLDGIRRDFPGWRPEQLAGRIQYCSDKIKALSGRRPVDEVSQLSIVPDIITRDPDVVEPGELLIALEMERMSDFESARDIYEEYLEVYPGDIEAMEGLVRCFLATGLASEAARVAEKIVQSGRDDLKTLTMVCMAYSASGQHEKAALSIRKAGAAVYSNADACVAAGVALAGIGRLDEAVAYMATALDVDPERSDAHYNLARLFISSESRDIEAARDHYNAYLRQGGEPDASIERGVLR